MEKYGKYFIIDDKSIHILKISGDNFIDFVKGLKAELPQNSYLAILNLENTLDLDDLYSLFARELHFPDYFGYNWDALDECINDLKWLNSNSYILIVKSLEKLNLDINTSRILVRLLKESVMEWTKGRTYNPGFPTPPTSFHIIFASETNNCDKIVGLLKSSGVENIDIIS